jgi:hypothetical protein
LWLPTEGLPAHVHLVVSCIPDDEYKVFPELRRRDLPAESYQPVELLQAGEIETILDGWLKADHRTLIASQRAIILQAAGSSPTSLKLRALYDLSPHWRSFDVPGEAPKPGLLPMVPKKLPGDVPGIIESVFARLEKTFGELLVMHAFGFLSLSVAGLSAEEMMDLLSMDNDVLLQVRQHPRPLLLPSTTILLCWHILAAAGAAVPHSAAAPLAAARLLPAHQRAQRPPDRARCRRRACARLVPPPVVGGGGAAVRLQPRRQCAPRLGDGRLLCRQLEGQRRDNDDRLGRAVDESRVRAPRAARAAAAVRQGELPTTLAIPYPCYSPLYTVHSLLGGRHRALPQRA